MQGSREGFCYSHVWVTGMLSISHCLLIFKVVSFHWTKLPLCWRTYGAGKAESRGLRHSNTGHRIMICTDVNITRGKASYR